MSQPDEYAGQVLEGKYRLEVTLGRGGMGTVYRATHLGTDRIVAVKVIAKRFGQDADFVERFRREARAAGRLRHPNVVDVTDFGFAEIEGYRLAYLVMEFLDGCSLADVLKDEGRLSLPVVVDILEQVGSAVHEAHQLGIIHRDLKPDNLWLEPDRRGGFRVKVLDFGVAKLAEAMGDTDSTPAPESNHPAENSMMDRSAPRVKINQDAERTEEFTHPISVTDQNVDSIGKLNLNLTQAGFILGTPVYMSPEQCRGAVLDARSDIYSIAVIAYQMLAGEPPFAGDVLTVLRSHVHEVPPPLRSVRRDIPAPVSEWIASALAKDAAKRPQTAIAFATALRARAERPLEFFRNIQTLFAARLPVFLRISFLAHLPLMILGWLLLGLGAVLPAPAPWAYGGLGLAATVFFLVALLATSTFCDAVVMQSLAVPMRTVRLETVVKGLKSRLPAYLRTLAPTFFFSSGFFLLIFLPGWWKLILLAIILAILRWFGVRVDAMWFAQQVVALEGLSGREALDRSRVLAVQSRRFLPALQGANYAIAIGAGLLFLVGFSVAGNASAMGPLGEWGAVCSVTGLLLVLIMPLLTVPFSLLYFRTREAAGETLSEILAGFEKAILPPGSWQLRIKDMLRIEIHSRK